MKGFSGFQPGEESVTLPAGFFSELLPAIDDLAELKLTLFLLRARAASSRPPLFSVEELEQTPDLLRALAPAAGRSAPEKVLRRAIERAAARGTLLVVVATRGDNAQRLYLVNDAAGRQLARQIEAGLPTEAELTQPPAAWRVERPNIFILYEQNIGLLQPLIADELREAEKLYPAGWIEDAFRIAAARNARSWRFVRGVLERWARQGKTDDDTDSGDSTSTRRRYIEGEYGQLVKH